MKPRIVIVMALLLAGGLLAGGCSSGGGGAGSATQARNPGSEARNLADKHAGRGGQAQVSLAPGNRSVVYTARLGVRVTDVAKARGEVTSIVTAVDGYVARERTSKNPDDRDGATARLTVKVPVDDYPSVLHRLSTDLGTRQSLKRRARDVTKKVADVDSRVRSARASLDRLRALLGEAQTVGQVLKVEEQISEREADLEALEAQQKVLEAKTSYATIKLRLHAPAPPGHAKEAGFLSGLLAGWDAFRAMVVWLLTALGAIAPFAVILGGLAYGGWRAYRLLRGRRPTPTTSE